MRSIILAVAISAAAPALADPATFPECFDISVPHGGGPVVDILVNKCTGETWFLTTVQVPATATQAATWYWKWYPIPR